ncbi:MAG: hypothetical protein VZR36_12700, partial [Prevotella sp.]|nr:hypothetical protein [Prevotella sp.]
SLADNTEALEKTLNGLTVNTITQAQINTAKVRHLPEKTGQIFRQQRAEDQYNNRQDETLQYVRI